jgi:Tfp pilus assembly protein PilF
MTTNTNQPNRKSLILEMLKTNPKDTFLNYALGLEYMAENKNAEAIEMMENVLKGDVNYIPCYYQLGKLYELVNNNEKAKENYKAGLEIAKIKNDLKTVGELSEALWMIDDEDQ